MRAGDTMWFLRAALFLKQEGGSLAETWGVCTACCLHAPLRPLVGG